MIAAILSVLLIWFALVLMEDSPLAQAVVFVLIILYWC